MFNMLVQQPLIIILVVFYKFSLHETGRQADRERGSEIERGERER